MLVLFLGIILLVVVGYGTYHVMFSKDVSDGGSSPPSDNPDTPTPTPPSTNDDSPGGGPGEKVPSVYAINNRPVPDGVDPLDTMPTDHVFPMPKIMGFYENWVCYKPGKYQIDLGNIPIDGIAIGLYSFFGIADDGKLLYSDQWGDYGRNQLNGFVSNCNQNGVIPGMSVGGYTYSGNDATIKGHRFSTTFETDSSTYKSLTGAETWNRLFTIPAAQQNFINSIGTFMTKHGFKHVDIDYEYPNCPGGECDATRWDQRDAFTQLMTNLCTTYPSNTFSIDITPNKFKLTYTDLGKLNAIANLTINIMSYDFHVNDPTGTNPSTGHNQTLLPGHSAYTAFNIKDCLDYISKQNNFDGSKYRIGIAAYGRGYALSTEAYNAAVATDNYSYLPYIPFSPDSYSFPGSQQKGVVFSSELSEIKGNTKQTYVSGDGMWLATDDGPGIFSVPSKRGVFAVRWLASQYGINDIIVWTPTQDYTNDGKFNIMPFVKATKM